MRLRFALTDLIARMTSGPLIDDSVEDLQCKVWGDQVIAQLLNQFLAVVALIGAEGYSMPAGDLFNQRYGRLRFGAAGGLGHAALDCDAVAVLHQHVAGVAELSLLARALAGQAGLGIGGRLVSVVAASLAMEVHAGVARIVRRSLWPSVFSLEALVAGPGLDQCAVDREVLVGEQPLDAGLVNHRVKNPSATSPLSSRSRFLVNTVTSHTGSSRLSPTNQRNRKL